MWKIPRSEKDLIQLTSWNNNIDINFILAARRMHCEYLEHRYLRGWSRGFEEWGWQRRQHSKDGTFQFILCLLGSVIKFATDSKGHIQCRAQSFVEDNDSFPTFLSFSMSVRITPRDLDFQNVIESSEDGTLTALIDWDDVHRPQYPSRVTRDWNP